MIPIKLTITGFLSYHQATELDFSAFELACIAGPNGAGKSSLLDAITWCLFGQARKRDDSLIHTLAPAAEVSLVFFYEGNLYRVQRSKPRDKTGLLEFHILQDCPWHPGQPMNGLQEAITEQGRWKALTERTLRETEACIEHTLRMDYETFVNASFFLQGKADQFTQQRPSDRKRILSSILGLEVWEAYRQRAADHRKEVELVINRYDALLADIQHELGEEDQRRAGLAGLETELKRLSQVRQAQENALDSIRAMAATLLEQRRLLEALRRQLDATRTRLAELDARLGERRKEQAVHSARVAHAAETEAAYAGWQAARKELEQWEQVASQFREHEKLRQAPLAEIGAERARMEEQLRRLQEQETVVQDVHEEAPLLEQQVQAAQAALKSIEERLQKRLELDRSLQEARQNQAEARAENPRLKAQMDELKERIDRLSAAEGADCPLCGQPLSSEDRLRLIDSLTAQGRDMGDSYRANRILLRDAELRVQQIETEIASLANLEADLRTQTRTLDQLNDRLESVRRLIADWEQTDAPRLAEAAQMLKEERFALEARQRLAEVDAQLKATGYDAAAHDQTRLREQNGRASEANLRSLEMARAALAPLEREIADLQAQITTQQAEALRLQEEHDRAAAALAAAEAQAPDLYTAERQVYDLQEQENRLRMEVGAARQKVLVLADLKARQRTLNEQREEQSRLVSHYKQLERAFGKDGVPALLIEQALPQIESKANEILDRLSAGNMSVRFITQASYKDKKRDDLKETLEIQVSDSTGTRDFELFSGGESFRVNFSIRLALSEVLAQRAGARLQTLVIDEGFGSQDALGRQRLIEAINLVRADFAKVLVITHIDELKDAFPNRIEVEKTASGSRVNVV